MKDKKRTDLVWNCITVFISIEVANFVNNYLGFKGNSTIPLGINKSTVILLLSIIATSFLISEVCDIWKKKKTKSKLLIILSIIIISVVLIEILFKYHVK